MTLYQFDLEDEHGAHLTCWLEHDRRLKPGVVVTLKETGDRKWTVTWKHRIAAAPVELHRHWTVGGLA